MTAPRAEVEITHPDGPARAARRSSSPSSPRAFRPRSGCGAPRRRLGRREERGQGDGAQVPHRHRDRARGGGRGRRDGDSRAGRSRPARLRRDPWLSASCAAARPRRAWRSVRWCGCRGWCVAGDTMPRATASISSSVSRSIGPPRSAAGGGHRAGPAGTGELSAASDGMGAEILEFQLALLEDHDLLDEARASHRCRRSAPGLGDVLDRQILSYEDFGGRVFPRAGQRPPRRGDARPPRPRRSEDARAHCCRAASWSATIWRPQLSCRWTGRSWAAWRWSAAARRRMWRCWPAPVACPWRPISARCRKAARPCSTPRRSARGPARPGDPRALPAPARPTSAGGRRGHRASIRPAVTAGGERVEVMLNIDDPAAVGDDLLDAADGVGLFRTEFCSSAGIGCPTRSTQFVAISGCSTGCAAALHRAHARHRWRQAAAGLTCRPRPIRSSACAACACAWTGPTCSGRRSGRSLRAAVFGPT